MKSALNLSNMATISADLSADIDVPVLLKALDAQSKIIEQKSENIDKQSKIIEQKSKVIGQQKKRIAVLEEYLRLSRAQRFGSSSEKSPDQQEMVFNSAEAMEDDEQAQAEEAAQHALDELNAMADTASAKKRGRKGLSPNLPRVQVRLELSDEDKVGAIDTFFTVIKEELDIQRPKAQVIEYLQEKAVFIDVVDDREAVGKEKEQDKNKEKASETEASHPSKRIIAAEQPKHPLNKCIASIGLLCHIVIAKYCDGLSLYGLEKMMSRYGGSLTRTAMANWIIRLSGELQPLINLAREHQLAYDYLQIDETRVQVLKEEGKSAQSKKWMWVSKGGPPNQAVVLFDYDPSRGAEVSARLLDGFQGYLQCDGYASYNAPCESDDIIRLGCFDHARRKFNDAIKAQPKSKKVKASVADIGLSKINALYRLERTIKALPSHEKYQKRQTIAVPLLNDLKAWADTKITNVPKDQLTHKALNYLLNQWDYLIAYCQDGRLHISNAGAENAIRPFAVGRRRWLFCDTASGAKASAIHYSLIETAKANELSPEAYYAYILPKIPYAQTIEDWEALLPWNVKAFLKNSG